MLRPGLGSGMLRRARCGAPCSPVTGPRGPGGRVITAPACLVASTLPSSLRVEWDRDVGRESMLVTLSVAGNALLGVDCCKGVLDLGQRRPGAPSEQGHNIHSVSRPTAESGPTLGGLKPGRLVQLMLSPLT